MFTTGQRREVEAFAKVNLFLEVLGTRADGYHTLRSVIMPIALSDRLEVTLREDGRVQTCMEGPIVNADAALQTLSPDQNLVTRAARSLQQAAGCSFGADMRVYKRIPAGGGLGGGSADAAAALVVLNELWQTGWTRAELAGLGAKLGCDVPPLLYGVPTLVEGVGEQVTPLPDLCPADSGCWMVLVNPGFVVSTRDIYQRCTQALTSGRRTAKRMLLALRKGDAGLVSEALFNGLQATVFQKYPLIEILADRLKEAGALGSLVSGSGGTVFGLTGDRDHALAVQSRLRAQMGFPLWSVVTRMMPDGVMAAHGPLEARV